MEATIGINVRVPESDFAALDKIAGRGEKGRFLRALLKKELRRRRLLPAAKRTIRRKV